MELPGSGSFDQDQTENLASGQIVERLETVGSFPRNIHYHLRSPLTMKAGPQGEAGGRRRRAVGVLSGPDPWNEQRTGLAGWPSRQRSIGCRRKPCPEIHFRGKDEGCVFGRMKFAFWQELRT